MKVCNYCDELRPEVRPSPFMADGAANMCKDCWEVTRESHKDTEMDIGEFKDYPHEMYNKFLVLKWDDILNVLEGSDEFEQLEGIIRRVMELRKFGGRDPEPSYYVVNKDEPYADKVLELIQKEEEKK